MSDKHSGAIRRITLTGILLALLIGGQVLLGLISAPLSQYVVGSWVNLIIGITALTIGWPYALAVSLISPFIAFMLAIAPPFIEFTPFIALGNGLFALTMHFIHKVKLPNRFRIAWGLMAVTIAAGLKTALLYTTIVLLIMPTMNLLPAQSAAFTAVFSVNQLLTALIGGALAILSYVPLKHALDYRKGVQR
ncbi:MAG: ECF transporter S component [Bacilli bacterium]|jgi:predicted membrane protein